MVSIAVRAGGSTVRADDFLGQLYVLLADGLDELAAALAGSAGMGGRVASFTSAYDPLASAMASTGCDLAGAVAQLELMVHTTFGNYARADVAADLSRPLGGVPPLARPPHAAYPIIDAPPSAAGDNGGEPWVWHLLVAVHPEAQWPDIDTARLRAAGTAWSALASVFDASSTFLDGARVDLARHQSPELPVIEAVLAAMRSRLASYTAAAEALAGACASVADQTDAAIGQIRHEVHKAEIMAGAGTVVSGVAAAATWFLGGSGGAASESAMSAVLAGTIGATIAGLCTDLVATVTALCEGLAVMLPVLQASALAAAGILEASTVEAAFDDLGAAGALTEEEIQAVEAEVAHRFVNLGPGDAVRPNGFHAIDPASLAHVSGRFNYVVGTDGRLVIANRRYGHIDLADGDDVLAAGEVRIVNGEVVAIDNASGHYRPSGAGAQAAADAAFASSGLTVRPGAYAEIAP